MGGKGCRVIEGSKELVEGREDVGESESRSCCRYDSSESEVMIETEAVPQVVEEEEEEGGVLERGGECGFEGKEAEKVQESQSNSGKTHDEISFSLGLGVGLIFLLARSMNDFNKMAEMRREVEAILKEVKDLMPRKYLIHESIESKNRLTFAGSDSCGDEELTSNSLLQNHSPSFHLTESPAEHDENSSGLVECSQNLDKLEGEFESEFELMMNNDCNEYHCKLEMMGENSDISESSNGSSEADLTAKENREQDVDDSCQYGVCPRELERRLHELLQTRQQERIAELESALQRAEQKLREKEIEMRWYRDTTQISHHRNEEVFR